MKERGSLRTRASAGRGRSHSVARSAGLLGKGVSVFQDRQLPEVHGQSSETVARHSEGDGAARDQSPRFRATFGSKPSRDERTLSANGSSAARSPLAPKFGEVCAPRIACAAPSRGVFDALHTSSCQIRVKMKKRAGSVRSLTARFDLVAGAGFEPTTFGL